MNTGITVNRLAGLVLTVLAVAAAVGLYRIKYEVRALERHGAELVARIDRDRQAIEVLRAEWTHLARPQRLERLNRRFLRLQPLGRDQFARLGDLPLRTTPPRNDEVKR